MGRVAVRAGAAGGEGARRVAALQAAVARAQRRLDELRDSELARMLERAMAAAAAGQDHVATLRAHAELALADARARLAALEGASRERARPRGSSSRGPAGW